MSAAVAADPPVIPTATGPDPAVMEAIERGNAVVFLDVALGDNPGAPVLGRIKLELFVQDVRSNLKCNQKMSLTIYYSISRSHKRH